MFPRNPDYPARVDVAYPERLSRGLIFVKWLLLVPHYFALFFLSIGALFAIVGSWFAVLFTGRYPAGLFNFVAGVMRWNARVTAYLFLMTDAYPPFSLDDDPAYPIRVEFDYPDRIARWRPLVHWLLAIPVLLFAYGLAILAEFFVFLAFFAILFTGRFPAGLFNTVMIYLRWTVRGGAYYLWMTERYPPFAWA